MLKTAELLKSSIVYLALKMRSFNLKIRISALKAMKRIGEKLDHIHKEWDGVFRIVLPLMIEK